MHKLRARRKPQHGGLCQPSRFSSQVRGKSEASSPALDGMQTKDLVNAKGRSRGCSSEVKAFLRVAEHELQKCGWSECPDFSHEGDSTMNWLSRKSG